MVQEDPEKIRDVDERGPCPCQLRVQTADLVDDLLEVRELVPDGVFPHRVDVLVASHGRQRGF